MLRTALFAAALACAVAPPIAPAFAQTPPPPAEAYGRLPAISDVGISPDGRRLALALSNLEGQSSVAIVDLDDVSASTSFALHERDQLRGVGWADDRRVAFLVSQTLHPGDVLPPGMRFTSGIRRIDYWRNGLIDIETQRVTYLSTDEQYYRDQGASLHAPIEGDPGAGRLLGRDGERVALYRVDLASGRVSRVSTHGANDNTIGLEIDETGTVYARYDSDDATNRWQIYLYEDGRPRLLMEDFSEFGEPVSLQGMLPDGTLVALDRPTDEDFYRLFTVDRANGARAPFFQRDGVDVFGAIHDRWNGRIVGAAWAGERSEVEYFDPQLQAAWEHLSTLMPGEYIELLTWSRDRRRFVFYMERGLDGGGYYVFTPAEERITQIALRYPELQSADQGAERQAINYPARDGVRIPAYLTLPPSGVRQNLPLVLLVHGGPHARDDFSFDWWSAFLASRGYAVLQPNFRGSSGYGHAWQEAGKRQWGALMQTDVEDGVAALGRAGIIDPARVCIVGASYGDYAALAGATLTPERYRCAASIAGVSDLERMLRATERQTGGDDTMTSDWWRASIGDREEDRERIRAVSPANLADRVQIPVLLIHGVDDTVVPIDQSHLMRDRLRSAGKDVRFVELRGDDHWLSDAPTRTQMLRELETFLAANLGRGAQ
jgi:dipeptidyl aminopeptidase/acylaminoacyl peptidase